MDRSFKDVILRLLSATNYSLDNLSHDNIRSFNNLKQLKSMFEFLSYNLSEANCITPEEMKEFKKLQVNGEAKYYEELEGSIQVHLYNNGNSSVPYKETLNDIEQELTLLEEQLHYKQVLYNKICSSIDASDVDIQELKKKNQKAEIEHKEVMTAISSANKSLTDITSKYQANLTEIVGLVCNDGDTEISTDEGIHSLTSENINLNPSLSSSVWSLATSSSWQTIKGQDSNMKYLCHLSVDKYLKIGKQFLKRLTKHLENSSKIGKYHINDEDSDYIELHMIKERLKDKLLTLIENVAELESIRTAQTKVNEMRQSISAADCLLSRLKLEEEEFEIKRDESFNMSVREEVVSVVQQWADRKILQALECKIRERVEFAKCSIEKMEELIEPLLLKLSADTVLYEIIRYQKDEIDLSIQKYNYFYKSMIDQFNAIEKRIQTMQNNLKDFKQFCMLPLEEMYKLIEHLASIMFCDIEDVVQTFQHLTETSQREHETVYEYFVGEKIRLVKSGNNLEETCNMTMVRSTCNEATSTEAVDSVLRGLDQMDSGIDDMNSIIHQFVHSLSP